MKKFLVMGTLALAVAALLELQAWAWKSSSLSMGMNWCHSSGGNNLLWGVYRNGQPGGCDLPNCPEHYYAVRHGYDPYGGCYYGNGYGNGHGFDYLPSAPAPARVPTMPPPTPVPGSQAYWYSQPPFQTVNYAPDYFGSYYTPMNWYGR
ncbi:MAG TPA: hypothetical protein VKE98_05385 [Gemmataceae bacterium]|nr:hypothetical protein [Gemmataceae bacterium]